MQGAGNCTFVHPIPTLFISTKLFCYTVFSFTEVSLSLSQCVDVQPNDGFGTILPQETISLDLMFSANKPRDYSFELTCLNHLNRYIQHTELYRNGIENLSWLKMT